MIHIKLTQTKNNNDSTVRETVAWEDADEKERRCQDKIRLNTNRAYCWKPVE